MIWPAGGYGTYPSFDTYLAPDITYRFQLSCLIPLTQYTLLPSQPASCHIHSVLLWSIMWNSHVFDLDSLSTIHIYSYSSMWETVACVIASVEDLQLGGGPSTIGGVQLPGKINGLGVEISLDVWTRGPNIRGVQPYFDNSHKHEQHNYGCIITDCIKQARPSIYKLMYRFTGNTRCSECLRLRPFLDCHN